MLLALTCGTSISEELTREYDETNCTRVTVNKNGLLCYVKIKDDEIEKLSAFIAENEELGFVVITERGVWID
jgi:hypothetical protein